LILWFDGPRSLAFHERAQNQPSGSLDFISELIGISPGSELLVWKGIFPENHENPAELSNLREKMAYPIAYGYINVGRLADGRRVFCYGPHGDRLWVDPSDCVEIGDLPAEDAVFLANTETALHIIQSSVILPGHRVAVWGLGVVGLLVCAILRLTHRGPLVAFDPIVERRKRSQEIGVQAFHPEEAERVNNAVTNGEGFEICLELSGSPDVLGATMRVAAEEGKVIVGSWYGCQTTSLRLGEDFHRKRLKIHASQVSVPAREMGSNYTPARRRDLALELLRELQPSRWITHRFPLTAAADAYSLLEVNPETCLQVVLEP